jgi:hypothetical protein
MTDQKNQTRFTEQQMASATLFSAPILDGIERASQMQSDGLQRLRTVMSEVLDRQLAGCTATQNLIAQVRATRDPTEILKAQQEWFTGAMQRLMANATWWQATGLETLKGINAQQAEAMKAPAASVSDVAAHRTAKTAT